jgi:hypothetical protein
MGTGMTALDHRRMTQANVALLRQDTRLLSLLTALEADDGRVPQVPPDLAAALPALVADAELQLEPLSVDDMRAELTAIMGVMGAGLPQNEKKEFMIGGFVVLEQFPAALCREALHDALTECTSLRQVLNHVKTYCEDYPQRMRNRFHRLQQLQAIVDGQSHV